MSKSQGSTCAADTSLTPKEIGLIAVLSTTLIPFALVIFFGLGHGSPFAVAAAAGLAIVAASYFLSWATEAMQTLFSQAFALTVLALIQVAPEYAFEAVLAYNRQLEYAAATMTGANRLILGLGWPLIYFVMYFASRRRGKPVTEVVLHPQQSLQIVFLGLATLYSFIFSIKATLTVWDGLILASIYGAFLVMALRLPPMEDCTETPTGVGHKICAWPPAKKRMTILLLLLFGAVVIFFGAEPFLEALMEVAERLGIPKYGFVQYFAPFLSEFPESLTAFIWAAMIIPAAMGLTNLISSKLNQWTLLIAAVPAAYSLSLGHIAGIPLNQLQVQELFLTSAQSLYGVACLLTLRFGIRQASTLLGLFTLQFFFSEVRIQVGVLYLILTVVEIWIQRRHLVLFSALYETLVCCWPNLARAAKVAREHVNPDRA